jgi:hypothetical protein
LSGLKKINPTNAKNKRPPKKYTFFAVLIPADLNLMLIRFHAIVNMDEDKPKFKTSRTGSTVLVWVALAGIELQATV